jgi:hypothetical protein
MTFVVKAYAKTDDVLIYSVSFSQYAIAPLHPHKKKKSTDAGHLIPIWSTKEQGRRTLVEAVMAVRL